MLRGTPEPIARGTEPVGDALANFTTADAHHPTAPIGFHTVEGTRELADFDRFLDRDLDAETPVAIEPPWVAVKNVLRGSVLLPT